MTEAQLSLELIKNTILFEFTLIALFYIVLSFEKYLLPFCEDKVIFFAGRMMSRAVVICIVAHFLINLAYFTVLCSADHIIKIDEIVKIVIGSIA